MTVIEVYLMCALIPWALISLSVQYYLIDDDNIHHFDQLAIDLMINLFPALTIPSYFIYEVFKRKANKDIYKE